MYKVVVNATIEGITPLSWSRHTDMARLDNESYDELEQRVAPDKFHANEEGLVILPALVLKNCLAEAAQYKGDKIQGKGNATWTKHFQAGIQPVTASLILKGGKPIHKDDLLTEQVFVPADGKRGSGKRVNKIFPVIHAGTNPWTADITLHIFDSVITQDVFRETLYLAGNLIGIGRFRPRNNGYYGRFSVTNFQWLPQPVADSEMVSGAPKKRSRGA